MTDIRYLVNRHAQLRLQVSSWRCAKHETVTRRPTGRLTGRGDCRLIVFPTTRTARNSTTNSQLPTLTHLPATSAMTVASSSPAGIVIESASQRRSPTLLPVVCPDCRRASHLKTMCRAFCYWPRWQRSSTTTSPENITEVSHNAAESKCPRDTVPQSHDG